MELEVNEWRSEKTWETQPRVFQLFNTMHFETDLHSFDNADLL